MHRSSSTTRASDFFLHGASSSSSSARPPEAGELPTYDPLSDFAKKERLRMKFAENAVHVIPLVLVLCAAILWFFSNPDLEMAYKEGSIVSRIEGLTIDGDTDVAHARTGLLSSPDLGDFEREKKPIRLFAR